MGFPKGSMEMLSCGSLSKIASQPRKRPDRFDLSETAANANSVPTIFIDVWERKEKY